MKERENLHDILRESSFNMTRGDEHIEGGGPKNFLTPERGALKKLGGGFRKFVYFKTNRRGGAPKKLNR